MNLCSNKIKFLNSHNHNIFLQNSYYVTKEFYIEYRQAFMSILMESWKVLYENKLQFYQPPQVVKEAEEYMKYNVHVMRVVGIAFSWRT